MTRGGAAMGTAGGAHHRFCFSSIGKMHAQHLPCNLMKKQYVTSDTKATERSTATRSPHGHDTRAAHEGQVSNMKTTSRELRRAHEATSK